MQHVDELNTHHVMVVSSTSHETTHKIMITQENDDHIKIGFGTGMKLRPKFFGPDDVICVVCLIADL